MSAVAIAISLCALIVSVVFAIRQERWRQHELEINTQARQLEADDRAREAADREEQLALNRYQVEHDESGWRRWGSPPKREDR